MIQDQPNKAPLQSIIGFFKINFNHHKPFPSFSSFKRVNEFLSYNDIIRASSPCHKGSLKRGDKSGNKMSKPLNKNFRQNLIDRVAKTNGPKVANRSQAILFGNESNQGLIEVVGDFTILKNLLDFMLHRSTDIPPKPLVKTGMNPIRPRSFEGFHGKQGICYLQIRGR